MYHEGTMKKPRPFTKRFLPLAAALLLLPSAVAADIYRWVDDAGTIHFTDEPANIPPSRRKEADRVIRDAPRAPAPAPAPEGTAAPAPEAPPAGSQEPEVLITVPDSREDVSREAAELRAKINAKENLIRTVEQKQSLATNPYRNRFVDRSDLDLYQKYKAELPQDREKLKALEERLKE